MRLLVGPGLFAVQPAAGVLEHHDLAAVRPVVAPVRHLLHHDPVVDHQARLHRSRGDVERLDEERLDQYGEHDRQRQQHHGLEPERQLATGGFGPVRVAVGTHDVTLRQRPTPRPSNATGRRRTFVAWSPTPPERPRPRCSRRRSAPTSSARWRSIPTARRWSRSPAAGGGPGPSWTATSTRWPAGCSRAGIEQGDRVGIWAPNCAEWTITQYATAKIGAILVNVNPAYRTHELAYAVNQSGMRLLISATEFKTSDYRSMVEEVRRRVPAAGAGGVPRHRRLVRPASATPAARCPADAVTSGCTSSRRTTRSTSSTPRAPPATPRARRSAHRNILNNGYLTTELINFTEQDRLCIPVPFYHCFGMVMGNLGCTTHGATMVIPAPGFDPEITLRCIAEERCTGVYGVPDDVHRDAEPRDVRRARPLDPADRDHGGLDLPGRGDEAVRQRHAHGGGVDRLRHDRDLAGLVPDPRRRRPRPAYRHDRPGAPARRDQGRRPGDR